MAEPTSDALRDAAPNFDDLEAKRARAGVAAALFADLEDEEHEALRPTVGRYRIDSRLGAGGMGVVYRAHDPDLDRPVAVKLLHADSSTDDKARARMLREARSLAKLSHPNVITVYDVGTEDGQVFVAMELVAGVDLRRWLEDRTPAQWRDTLDLFIAAGRGLEAAHEVGLIHRDFKPENVLVGDDGRVRVLDFGLARPGGVVEGSVHDGVSPSPSVVRTDGDGDGDKDGGHDSVAHMPTTAFVAGLTETGALIGTPLYMAPELYAGKRADARSDQFAFCASVYEGLYRQLPFGARDLTSHIAAVRAGSFAELPAGSPVPTAIERIVMRGLDPEPSARFADMATLLAALEGTLAEPVATEVPEYFSGSGGAGRWLAIGGVLLAAIVGLVGFELGWFGAEPPEVALDGAVVTPIAPEPAPKADVDPGPEVPEVSEVVPEQPANVGAETGAATEGETGGETGEASEEAAPNTEPERSGWCHLHEDRYTLLARTKARQGSFEHQGRCYACRVETRRSRTRNFSPRDCAGYSLCWEASADECR